MNPFHNAWRVSAVVRPRLASLTLALAVALGAVACSSASDDPAPTVHHDPPKGADSTVDSPDAGATEDASMVAPTPSSDWGTAGGSGGGGAGPASSSRVNQPKRVQ